MRSWRTAWYQANPEGLVGRLRDLARSRPEAAHALITRLEKEGWVGLGEDLRAPRSLCPVCGGGVRSAPSGTAGGGKMTRSEIRLLEILQDAISTVEGWGGPEGLRWPPIRDWQRDPYYAWAWGHARGRVVEALQAAVDHPKVIKGNPEAIEAVKALYRAALEAGLPVPQGVQALVKKGRGGA